MVSIIMPAFNVEKYISDAIKSVQNQTCLNWELIVVDDGSLDSTKEVIEPFLNDKRIRLIKKSNEGVSKARNIAIDCANGEYLAFLDSDDLWDKTFLEKCCKAMDAENVGMVYSGYDFLWEGGRRTSKRVVYREGALENFFQIKGFVLPLMISSVMIKRSLIEQFKINFTETCFYGEDIEFILKVLAVTNVKAIKEKLLHYRIRSTSVTQTGWSHEKLKQAFESYQRAIEFIKAKHNEGGLLEKCNQIVIYRKYRYIWEMMQHGYYSEAQNLISLWRDDLKSLIMLPIRLNRKFQCMILLYGNSLIWKFFKK